MEMLLAASAAGGAGSLDVWQIAMVACATLLAALVSGIGGFGGGFVIAIFLTPIVGAKALLPLLSVFAFCSNVSRVVVYRRSISWTPALVFLFSSAPGVAAGTAFFDWAPERLVLFVLGITLILFIPIRRYLARHGIRPGPASFAGIGLMFGFISGTAVGSGMFVVAALSGSGLAGPALLGTDAFIGLANSAMRVVSFASLGTLTRDLFIAGLLMGLLTVPGTLLAKRLVERMGPRAHTSLMEALILTGGCFFLFEAVTAGTA